LSASQSAHSPVSLLSVNIRHHVGSLALDVAFELIKPWTVLFGPSGSGKTTLLRTIQGFVQPGTGRIARGNTVLFDSSSRLIVPPHLRPIRSAAQTARLFPHMTVRSNAVYGSGWTKKPQDGMATAEQIMALFRIQHLADRMPADLSGGERQRASVARAVVAAITSGSPDQRPLLLLDEPFSGLDAALRDDLLAELRAWLVQWHVPVLSVTHDVGEAFQLGAEVIKLAEGRITQQGPVESVLAEERLRLMTQLRD